MAFGKRSHRNDETSTQLRRAKIRHPVTTIRTKPSVWQEAMRLAEGDARKIHRITYVTVAVYNDRRYGS